MKLHNVDSRFKSSGVGALDNPAKSTSHLCIIIIIMCLCVPCGVGHITKNSTNVFSACRKRRLKETGRGDWESPPL